MEILKIIQVYGITDENNVSLENNEESKLGNIQDTAGNNGLINEQNTQIQEIIIDDKENNIKDILKERNSTLDTEKQLTWTVENPEIAEIDEKGNILPKTEGQTNIIVKDETGNEEVIPIEIVSAENANLEENNNSENNFKSYIVISVILMIILIIVVIVLFKKKRSKEKSIFNKRNLK